MVVLPVPAVIAGHACWLPAMVSRGITVILYRSRLLDLFTKENINAAEQAIA
jgi:hypothetical protein